MTITPLLEQHARAVGAFLALLVVAYPREWHRGGLLLVVQLWASETWWSLSRYIRKEEVGADWISDRIRATRQAAGRYWRARIRRRARLKRYMLTWLARPEFQAELKRHASKRIAAVARRGH